MIDIFKKAQVAPVDVSELEFLVRYQTYVLEFIAHKTAPGNLEFPTFQSLLRSGYASSQQSPATIHGDSRALAVEATRVHTSDGSEQTERIFRDI
jgi:hypothetical protein